MKTRMLPAALSAIAGACVAGDPPELPAALQARVDAAAGACAAFEQGIFALRPGAVVRTDLDGDLRADWVLNEYHFGCSSAASLYANTGGSLSHFLVGEDLSSLRNQGWEMRSLGPHRVLLADVHGTQCDAAGYAPCVLAAVWDAEAGRWRSASAHWEE